MVIVMFFNFHWVLLMAYNGLNKLRFNAVYFLLAAFHFNTFEVRIQIWNTVLCLFNTYLF